MHKNIRFIVSSIMYILPPFFSYFLSNYFRYIFVKNNWLDSLLLTLILWSIEWILWHVVQFRYILYFLKLRKFANKNNNFIGISGRENENIIDIDEKNYVLVKNNILKYKKWTEPFINGNKSRFKIIWWTMIPSFEYIQETTRSKSKAKAQIIEIKDKKIRIIFNYSKFVNKGRNIHGLENKINGSATILFDKFKNEVMFFGYKNNNEKVAYNGFIFMT